ncbi:MAG: hypothetical protein ACI9CD_000755 [Candidatus Deianiraeaceae bacterium]|jgi:hypothetical protein
MEFKWVDSKKTLIACVEKNKLLNENMEEISQIVKDAYEDAILMGVKKESFVENLNLTINECCNLKT